MRLPAVMLFSISPGIRAVETLFAQKGRGTVVMRDAEHGTWNAGRDRDDARMRRRDDAVVMSFRDKHALFNRGAVLYVVRSFREPPGRPARFDTPQAARRAGAFRTSSRT